MTPLSLASLQPRPTTALIVLNPRDIPYCMKALQALSLPKCWISYMPEPAAAHHVNKAITGTSFDRYVLISDDCEPTQAALDLVLAAADAGHPVVTGYCNFDKELPMVNLCPSDHVLHPPPPIGVHSYRFYMRSEVEAHPEPLVVTKFAGLALTLMTREFWLRFPAAVTSAGGQMDYQLSWELQEAGIPIVAPVGAFVLHHKDKFGVYPDASPEKQLLIGARPPAVTWTNLRGNE